MRQIREVMTSDVVWVNPSARVKTAVILMKGHNIGALPVIHNSDGVVGLVTLHHLLGEPSEAAISELMETDFISLSPEATVIEAAELMNETGFSHLLVMEQGRLVGIVSNKDLMPELGRTYDPLTELPWSDTFREWAMDALKSGLEISVILFDLDQFGKFNKNHGHVMGDKVLKAASNVFKSGVDPKLDLVCRYGGDEFAIASLRLAPEAESLARDLQAKIAAIQIPGLPEGVSASWGMFGGRRTKEREDVHYAATIDDLITRASKNCIKSKPWVRAQEEVLVQERVAGGRSLPPDVSAVGIRQDALDPSAVPGMETPGNGKSAGETAPRADHQRLGSDRSPRLKIDTISFSSTASEASAGVVLRRGDNTYKREVSGYTVGGSSILRLFAAAAAGAVCKTLAPGHGIVIEDTAMHRSGDDDEVVTVVVMFISPRNSTRLAGSALVRRGDQYRAAVAALLNAVNRQIEIAPPAEEEVELGPG